MTTLRTAAQQALEALVAMNPSGPTGSLIWHQQMEAITTLRAALAEPEPFNPDWDRIEPLQENLREHMAEIQRLRAKLADPEYPLGQASTDVGVPVYVLKKAEPVQEPAFHGFMSADGTRVDLCFTPSAPRADGTYATAYYAAPPQRKPPATIDEMFDRMNKAPKGVFFGHDPMTIWMEAWRAAEQAHGITP